MSTIEKVLFVLIGIVLLLGTAWVISGAAWLGTTRSVTGPNGQPLNNAQAKQAEDPSNPCVPPPGYTEEAWRQHMSHHPDQYKQCLGK